MLIDMWERVLQLDEINIADNFFELGGNSIAAARFTNMLQERLGEAVQITMIYEMPTVASLAEYLAGNYRDAVAGICGQDVTHLNEESVSQLTQRDVAYVRDTLSALNRYSAADRPRQQAGRQ